MEDEKYLEQKIDDLQQEFDELKEQHEADDDAIRHELAVLWEAINELQGIDPAKAGEPK